VTILVTPKDLIHLQASDMLVINVHKSQDSARLKCCYCKICLRTDFDKLTQSLAQPEICLENAVTPEVRNSMPKTENGRKVLQEGTANCISQFSSCWKTWQVLILEVPTQHVSILCFKTWTKIPICQLEAPQHTAQRNKYDILRHNIKKPQHCNYPHKRVMRCLNEMQSDVDNYSLPLRILHAFAHETEPVQKACFASYYKSTSQ